MTSSTTTGPTEAQGLPTPSLFDLPGVLRRDTGPREKRIMLTAFYAQRGKTSHEIAKLIGVKRDTVATYGRDYGIRIIDCKRIRGGGYTPPLTHGWIPADGA